MRAGVEPFATWYYPFAWYSTFLLAEAAVALRDGRFFMLDRPGLAVSLFGWSVPFWLFFELLNYRLANWYYVFVPDQPVARYVGIAISFATVLPAIFLAERVLRAYGPWREAPGWRAGRHGQEQAGPTSRRGKGAHLGAGPLLALQAAGLAFLLLPLVWPRYLFPLVWVGVTLVADPWVYRRDPSRSLLADIERGRPRRMIRLLVGGMAIGLLWELFNVGARGKWIYTVPGLEELKLFEMPVLGFFGFPFLALEGWAAYQALIVAGLAVDPTRRREAAPGHAAASRSRHRPTRLAAVALAAVFSALVLRGMEMDTISSTTPRIADLDPAGARPLEASGFDVFEVAAADPLELARETGVDPARARAWIDRARLMTLRGIGSANADRLRAAGVASVEELATAPPDRLTARLAEDGQRVHPARIRVWWRAARDAVGAND